MRQLISFRRAEAIVSEAAAQELSAERVQKLYTLNKELSVYGYVLNAKAMGVITDSEMEEIHKDILPYLWKKSGSGHNFKTLYPGFPNSVMTMDEDSFEFIQQSIYDKTIDINSLMDKLYEYYVQQEGTQDKPLKEIGVISEKEFKLIAKNIMLSPVSLDSVTESDLSWFLDTYKDLEIPEIPFKETLCKVMAKRPEMSLTTVTDVLRYGLYLLGSDPAILSVPKKIRLNPWDRQKSDNPEWRHFNSLPRTSRKEVLSRLDKTVIEKGICCSIVDGKRNYGHWMLLAERVHPGDYKKEFPNALAFFNILLNNEKSKSFRTWESKIQEMYNTGCDIIDIAKKVSERPGELVRRFDSLFRRALSQGKHREIMDLFLDSEGKKTKTLLDLMGYYDRRGTAPRMISTKNSAKKHILDQLEPYSEGMTQAIKECVEHSIVRNVQRKASKMDSLSGKLVYIDPMIKKLPVATEMRTSTSCVPRGSQLSFTGNCMRFFVHWVQEYGKFEDLDLSATFVNVENKNLQRIAFNDSKICGYAVFSGDVRGKDGDCAEYIDFDVEKAIEAGFTHVIMTVHNYEGRGLDSLPSWYGYVTREKLGKKGSLNWKPSNVDFEQKATSNSSTSIAWLVDLKEKTAIAIDVPLDSMPFGTRTSATLEVDIARFYTTELTFSSYDILKASYEGRGAVVLDQILVKEDDSEDETIVDEKISFNDILLDYTKVTSLL